MKGSMTSTARLLAFGDVHGVQYLGVLRASLKSIQPEGLHAILLAGDIIDRGDVSGMNMVLSELTSRFKDVPIVSVFGNDEYHEVEDYLIKNFSYVVWLNDSLTVLRAGDITIGIVGSRGSLDRLTYWQSKNMPQLETVYKRRVSVLRKLLEEVSKVSDIAILLTHYAPTYQTIKGEPEKIYPYMGCRHLEEVIREVKPDVAIHAHAHNATVTEAVIGLTRVYNVSLPARKGVTHISVAPRVKLVRMGTGAQR
ncbi:MAG: metallophosphoesterase [Sulfolobales archaeon]